MNLYDRAVTLGVKLDAAASADSNDAVLAQGQLLVTDLDLASARMESAATMRDDLAATAGPSLNAKETNQAIGAFRAGLSRHGAAAFQHAPAVTLRDLARQQSTTVEKWTLANWRRQVAERTPYAALATPDKLQGNPTHRQRVDIRLRKLATIRDLNPLLDRDRLRVELQGDTPAEWLQAAAALDREISDALNLLEETRAKQSPRVRAAMSKAGSVYGLPLDEVTHELLDELRAAGVDDQLVVRLR